MSKYEITEDGKTVTPNAENVIWDDSGCIEVDGRFIGKIDADDCRFYGARRAEAIVDESELREAIAEIVKNANDGDLVPAHVAAFAKG